MPHLRMLGAVLHVLHHTHVRMVGGEVTGPEVGVAGDAADLRKVRRHRPSEQHSRGSARGSGRSIHVAA